jgi:hypothetical protein
MAASFELRDGTDRILVLDVAGDDIGTKPPVID